MFGHDELVTRALLVLESALCETANSPVPRSLALRFTLAYLYAVARRDRHAFDGYWRDVTDDRPCISGNEGVKALGRAQSGNAHLNAIYIAVGVKRTNDMMFSSPARDAAEKADDTRKQRTGGISGNRSTCGKI